MISPHYCHSAREYCIFLIVEHDPLLYEDAGEMVEYLAQALKQTSREATMLVRCCIYFLSFMKRFLLKGYSERALRLPT